MSLGLKVSRINAFATMEYFLCYSESVRQIAFLILLIDNSVPQNRHILSYRINK